MSASDAPEAVLFVCLGNICRSPTAAAVMRARLAESGLTSRVHVDSAATHAYRIDAEAHPETRQVAQARGYSLEGHRARLVLPVDFDRFDLILAMDRMNLRALQSMAPTGSEERLQLLMDFAPYVGVPEIPDPYRGPPEGYVRTLDLIEAGVNGLLRRLYRV
jgi:protein-tyrosine phosphatase